MKYNGFIIVAIFLCTSTLMHPIPFLFKQIVHMERFVKRGHATIDLLHDRHEAYPDQEETIIKMLAQQTVHVYVEDGYEPVASKHIKESLYPPDELDIYSILGLIAKLRKNGISASSVECREGFKRNQSATAKEVVDDYLATRDGLKVENPVYPVDRWVNEIIESVEKREEILPFCIKRNGGDADIMTLINLISEKYNIGLHVVDMIALKQLCKKDEHDHKVLIAGGIHCNGVALSLEKLGYKRTKHLTECKQNTKRAIDDLYAPYLHQNSTYIAIHRTEKLPSGISASPISPDKIKKYFEEPDSYKAS